MWFSGSEAHTSISSFADQGIKIVRRCLLISYLGPFVLLVCSAIEKKSVEGEKDDTRSRMFRRAGKPTKYLKNDRGPRQYFDLGGLPQVTIPGFNLWIYSALFCKRFSTRSEQPASNPPPLQLLLTRNATSQQAWLAQLAIGKAELKDAKLGQESEARTAVHQKP